MNADLLSFVRESLAHGVPRAAIAERLRVAGWRPEEKAAGLTAYAEVDSPVPVPRRRTYLSAREAFLYLVLFATLYTTAIDVGAVLFALLDRLLPDPGASTRVWRATAESARGSTAGLIIAYPIFLLLARGIGAAVGREPEKRGSKIRKWLTYLTLFVAAMVLIGDLIFLVSRLLSGELPLRVSLKVLVVFAIAGTVFGHFLAELRRDDREGAAPEREWRVPPRIAAALVLVVLVAGLALAGSPARERRRQLDAQRVADLSSISARVEQYAWEHSRLPESLDPVARGPGADGVLFRDPVTRDPYRYRTTDSLHYRLCAVFDAPDSMGPAGESRFWSHGRGPTCFDFEITPKLLREREPPRPSEPGGRP
jgi:hypothetical protein